MQFPLGKPILAMLFIALISGGFLAFRHDPPKTDLVMWTFVQQHADTYRSILDQFEKQTGKKVNIQITVQRAENFRLESMFMSAQSGDALPDVVEIEISNVARFFSPPNSEIGLLPLNDYLQHNGWDKRILPTRLATWTKGDQIFGVPHDVHPIAICYRKDLFDEANVAIENAKTWQQFQEMSLAFQEYWKSRGFPRRHAIELRQAAADDVIVMLLQRGINVIDQHEKIHVNDPIVAKTIAFYAQLVAGPKKIASESTGGSGVWSSDLIDGNVCSYIMPDWRVANIREYAPQMAGKMRMMPMPKFDPTDSPTATWGGTMIGITRASHHHDDAWKLIQFLYLSQTGLKARLQHTNILPPVIEQWNDPIFHASDPFFGGQKINELYVDLAKQLPPRYVSAVTPIAESELSVVIDRAAKYVQNYGTDGLEPQCQKWLDFAADDLAARIQHGRFDE
jgi:arabinosaccharide transport system substrate-binding protein